MKENVYAFIERFYKEQNGIFYSNAGDTFVEIIAALEGHSTHPVLGIIDYRSNARIKVSGTNKLISITKEEKIGGSDVSFGIYFDYDPQRIIKDIEFNSGTKMITLTVRANSRFQTYDSVTTQIYQSTFLDWTGDIKNPSSSNPVSSMDSKSPAHEDGGLVEIGVPEM